MRIGIAITSRICSATAAVCLGQERSTGGSDRPGRGTAPGDQTSTHARRGGRGTRLTRVPTANRPARRGGWVARGASGGRRSREVPATAVAAAAAGRECDCAPCEREEERERERRETLKEGGADALDEENVKRGLHFLTIF